MNTVPLTRFIALLLCFLCCLNQTGSRAAAQLPAPPAARKLPAPPPVPTSILTAKKVFLVNAGADPEFNGDPLTGYNAFYHSLEGWGRFQLVSSPEDADLIFRLKDAAQIGTDVTNGQSVPAVYPYFKLDILEAGSNAQLWNLTQPVQTAIGRDRNDAAVARSALDLTSQLKLLVGVPLAPTEAAELRRHPSHRGLYIALGAAVALAIGSALLLHHLYTSSVNNQKAAQDAFCAAHNIPLSQCAGG